jgi:hypothetical protein
VIKCQLALAPPDFGKARTLITEAMRRDLTAFSCHELDRRNFLKARIRAVVIVAVLPCPDLLAGICL